VEIRPNSLTGLMKPVLKSDLVYHVLVTKSLDFLLTTYTIKATRIQLKEIRRRLGTRVLSYELGHGLLLEFDLSRDHDAFLYDYLTRYGSYEGEVASILPKLITRETTFVDVGANMGYFTVMCSRLSRAVYAYEPVPAEFERLSKNIAINGLRNVRAFQCAVSKEPGRLKLYESMISDGHDSTVKRFEHDRSILVDAVSLDEAIDSPSRKIVLKVDAEGSEMDVLLGATGLIRSGRVSEIVLEWARGIYPEVSNLRERFALYSSLGTVEVLDARVGSYIVRDRHEIPDFCNLLVRVRR